jgi:Cu+-exporting ATPase
MAAMAASVTSLFINSLGGRPSLLVQAIGKVGRSTPPRTQTATRPT